tara:strand:- start:970 stop:1293 length:324 start_codon:yes stop_codon:yes gene_type:complete
MNGSITIGLISDKKLSDVHLIKFTKRLTDIFVNQYPNIKLGSNYKILDIIFNNRFEYDIIIYFYKKDIIKEYKIYKDQYRNRLYTIFKSYSDYMSQHNITTICLSQS